MMIDVDWVYREFLRRGYKQEYAADFLDQAWKNGDNTETRQRTAPDVFPFPPSGLVSELQEAASYYANSNDPNLRQQSELCTRAAAELAQRPEEVERDGFTLEEVAGAIARALDEANVKNEVLRGMCITTGLESLPDGGSMNNAPAPGNGREQSRAVGMPKGSSDTAPDAGAPPQLCEACNDKEGAAMCARKDCPSPFAAHGGAKE